MTICCESCKRGASAKLGLPGCCSSNHDTTDVNGRVLCKRFRSTKGASKARRDHINGEIRNMRDLLPIRPEERERLSYLHSMAAICTFIRKSVFYPELQAEGSGSPLSYEDFLQALPGFIVAMTREGKLIYVSENVVDYLGFSMVDVLQGDTFYDMVESADMEVVRSHLEAASILATEREFVCRMHTSKSFRLRQGSTSCSMLVRGHLQTVPQSSLPHSDLSQAFVAICTPTADQLCDSNAHAVPGHFHSFHWLDMTFCQVSDSVLFHLGYSEEEMIGQSWYSLLHPDDLTSSAAGHRSLLQGDEGIAVEMVLRLQSKDLSWVWLYVRAARDSGRQTVSCANYIISATEATFLRQKICTDISGDLRPSPQELSQPRASQLPQCHSEGTPNCFKRQRDMPCLSDEPWTKISCVRYVAHADQACDSSSPTALMDSPTFSTVLPYSPDSGLQDDLLLDSYSYTDDFLSPQESSPPYDDFLSPQESSPPYPSCHGGRFSPCESLQTVSDQAFHLSSLGAVSSQSPESSWGFPACPTDAHLVPDFSPGLDPCGATSDVTLHPEDFSLPLQPPEGAGPFLSPHSTVLLTPDPSPTTESCFQYSQEDQVEISILAQQISSLASSFHVYHNQSPTLSLSPAPCPTLGLPSAYAKASTEGVQALPPIAGWPHRLKPELVLDEDMIGSILKHLEQIPGREHQPCSRPVPACHPMHTCRLDALGVQSPPISVAALGGELPSTPNPLDPCVLTSGSHVESILSSGYHGDPDELHQLNHNRVCECTEGFYRNQDFCRRNTKCPSGHVVELKGTAHRDTVCVKCSPSSYSPGSSAHEPCIDHTDCVSLGL
ncbi:hypothetical protein AAFF_G00063000 [Aldrovandia affinis]|uniref:Neuronal PAS domain-containing protein 4-like n=1 Tax=Aldrovandia affinis TaxID=143900 RepID=A0AAD7RZS9_9TELE|nr:hypothetical protein AAFF_G00063000 [Aldrovandia affinis]